MFGINCDRASWTASLATVMAVAMMVNVALSCPDNLISRSEWGAQAPRRGVSCNNLPVDSVIIHHTNTSTCSNVDSCKRVIRSIQNHYMNTRGLEDIPFNFLVGGDGNLYEGRGWYKVGAHTDGYDNGSLGFAFVGNFTNTSPPLAHLQVVKNAIRCGVSHYRINYNVVIKGHRDLSSGEACPGSRLLQVVRGWPNELGDELRRMRIRFSMIL